MTASTAQPPKVTNASAGTKVRWAGHEWTVTEPCTNQAGSWVCLTHQEGFSNNLSVNGHAEDGRSHVLTWVCPDHGPEQPQ